jgi:hypothetical protein
MKRAIPLALLVAAIPCATPSCAGSDVTLATLPVSDASNVPGCTSNADCASDAYCDMPACDSTVGTCQLPPPECDPHEQPVCGCDDGITYFNDCLRKANSVRASSLCVFGAVSECGGPTSSPCPQGTECFQVGGEAPGECTTDSFGSCWVLPLQCPPSSDQLPDRWDSCVPGQHCVDTCTAIRSGGPYRRAAPCH